MRPGVEPFTTRTPRVVAARRLQRRRERTETGRFLAEGPQAVREALADGAVVELFATAAAAERYAELIAAAEADGARVSPVTDDALAALAETVQPQGVVAVCSFVDVPLAQALAKQPRLVAVLADIRDPGNAGTVLRTADAAGADAVVFAGSAVDPYNGKCVRASAGSLFHVDVVRADDPLAVVERIRAAGLTVYAADAYGAADLDHVPLAGPTAWLFGSEAHGLPPQLADAADARVRVPIHGRAESLNLAAAAAVCLYSCARAQRMEGTSR
ncbi:RNA methyltransferase [Planosporangium thailandense]|uniref:RNA methyltransferase n=1 Tax=Planosporangium thailandense TaxID=765197 RepID=A0ABX0Y351_9ACTN|nr:RNA methyltransferase [Planosporangium thailandense]NJC72778.1 RNA methyltransferase [Planosporangium thailandense]